VRRTITIRHVTDFAKPTATFGYNMKQVLPHSICIEFSSKFFYKTCPIKIWASSFPHSSHIPTFQITKTKVNKLQILQLHKHMHLPSITTKNKSLVEKINYIFV
jgi:hypothetical protein